MVKRLGLNIQDALGKIKNEILQENRETISNSENRYDKTIKHLNEDMQNLLLRYDTDFKTFSNSINDLI
jgi:flagellar capping protein FliD